MSDELRLRPAQAEDKLLLLKWANDSAVRSMARNVAPISAADHDRWFAAKLADPMCTILIAERSGVPVGQIRLDRSGDEAEVDISVDAAARGMGIGRFLLSAVMRSHSSNLRRLRATVRSENSASLQLFERAGFDRIAAENGFVSFIREIESSHAVSA